MTVTVTHAFTNPVADDPTFTGVKPSHWNAAHTVTGLGTAAELNVGTSANNIVQLDGSGKLPAVDGSQLTNLPGGSGAVDSVNGFTGTVVLDPDDLDDSATTNKFTTASDISKLSGIEAAADVTDATNVAAAGAVMDGDFSANGLMARTAAGAYASRTITGTTDQIGVSNGNGQAGNPTLALATAVTASLALADTALQSGDADLTGATIHAATGKTTPADADTTALIDSAASNVLKKLTWANLKATLKSYFDTLYAPIGGGSGLIVGADAVVTASSSESTGGSGNYNYDSSPTTAPTTSQAYRKDDATLAYTAQSASNKLRFNYAGSGSYTFSQINGTQRVHVVAALYRDSEANAIAWAVAYSTTITATTTGNQTGRCGFNLTFLVDPPDTSAHTYHVRFVNTTAPTGQGTMGAIVGRIFSVEEMAI